MIEIMGYFGRAIISCILFPFFMILILITKRYGTFEIPQSDLYYVETVYETNNDLFFPHVEFDWIEMLESSEFFPLYYDDDSLYKNKCSYFLDFPDGDLKDSKNIKYDYCSDVLYNDLAIVREASNYMVMDLKTKEIIYKFSKFGYMGPVEIIDYINGKLYISDNRKSYVIDINTGKRETIRTGQFIEGSSQESFRLLGAWGGVFLADKNGNLIDDINYDYIIFYNNNYVCVNDNNVTKLLKIKKIVEK